VPRRPNNAPPAAPTANPSRLASPPTATSTPPPTASSVVLPSPQQQPTSYHAAIAAISSALVVLHSSSAVRAATLALPLPPSTTPSPPTGCPVRAVRALFAAAEGRGTFGGGHLAGLLSTAASAVAAALPSSTHRPGGSASHAVAATVAALTTASAGGHAPASGPACDSLVDALRPELAEATSCGTCGAVTPLESRSSAGGGTPVVRHVSASGLSMVRSLLGQHATLASLLRELAAQEPAPCGAPGCAASACAVRRSVRVVPPAVCIGIDWGDGQQQLADVAAILDMLPGPLDVPASYSDTASSSSTGASATGADANGDAAARDRGNSNTHSLRALVLAPPPGSARPATVYTLPAEAASGWVQQYPPVPGGGGDSHASRDQKLTWAALRAKCVKDGATPVVALFTRDA